MTLKTKKIIIMNNIHSHNNHFLFILKKKNEVQDWIHNSCAFLHPDTRHIVPSSPPFIVPPVFTQTFLFEFLFSPILFKCIFDSEYMVRLPETPHFFFHSRYFYHDFYATMSDCVWFSRQKRISRSCLSFAPKPRKV